MGFTSGSRGLPSGSRIECSIGWGCSRWLWGGLRGAIRLEWRWPRFFRAWWGRLDGQSSRASDDAVGGDRHVSAGRRTPTEFDGSHRDHPSRVRGDSQKRSRSGPSASRTRSTRRASGGSGLSRTWSNGCASCAVPARATATSSCGWRRRAERRPSFNPDRSSDAVDVASRAGLTGLQGEIGSRKTRPGHPAGEEVKSYGVAKQTRCPRDDVAMPDRSRRRAVWFIPSSLYSSFVLPSPERTSLLIVHCALQYFLDPGLPARHVDVYDDPGPLRHTRQCPLLAKAEQRMANPWLKKNPLMSMWLSSANAAAGRPRSIASAETRKRQAELTKQTVRFWTDDWRSAIKPKRHR